MVINREMSAASCFQGQLRSNLAFMSFHFFSFSNDTVLIVKKNLSKHGFELLFNGRFWRACNLIHKTGFYFCAFKILIRTFTPETVCSRPILLLTYLNTAYVIARKGQGQLYAVVFYFSLSYARYGKKCSYLWKKNQSPLLLFHILTTQQAIKNKICFLTPCLVLCRWSFIIRNANVYILQKLRRLKII